MGPVAVEVTAEEGEGVVDVGEVILDGDVVEPWLDSICSEGWC